jgi:hypothetical protein
VYDDGFDICRAQTARAHSGACVERDSEGGWRCNSWRGVVAVVGGGLVGSL